MAKFIKNVHLKEEVYMALMDVIGDMIKEFKKPVSANDAVKRLIEKYKASLVATGRTPP